MVARSAGPWVVWLSLGACQPNAVDPPWDDAPAWEGAQPRVSAPHLIRGETVQVEVSGLSGEVEVAVYVAEALQNTCDDHTIGCVALADPVALAPPAVTTTAPSVTYDVGTRLGARFFQARAVDPTTGAATWSEPIQRDVMRPRDETPLHFTPVQATAGVGGRLSGNSHTGGLAWVDYNGDYWADLFVGNGAGRQHHLFRNNGDGTFADMSDRVAKPDVQSEDAGVWFADIDNDGDADLFVTSDSGTPYTVGVPQERPGGPNLLYRNEGNGTFTEIGEAAGIRDPTGDRNSSAAFADWDRDGFVDLHIGQWTVDNAPLGTHDDFDRLLRNRGDGTFEDVTAATGVDDQGLDALASMWFDPDMDGWPDLYVGNTNHDNDPPIYVNDDVIYRNQAGVFSEWREQMPWIGDDAGAAMGMDIGDLDNDGDWDLYLTDRWASGPLPLGNVLYLGEPGGSFSDNACTEQAVCTGYTGWPTSFADFDNDGWVDLYAGNNAASQPDLVFVNEGGTLVNQAVTGLNGHASRGGAQADFDGDGDVDLAIWALEQDVKLLRNDGAAPGHWLELRLIGTASNRTAIGALVHVTTDDHTLMRRVSGGDSAHSQSEQTLHFGVGDDLDVDVQITWPSGTVTTWTGQPTDAFVVVDEDLGVLDETLESGGASYSTTASTLRVELLTTYRGRTAPEVLGEPMVWTPGHPGSWVLERPMPGIPGTITVTTPRTSFEVSVLALP